MSYHVETPRFGFKELPERILVREDGAYGDNKEHGKPITDYWYVPEWQALQSEDTKLRELARELWLYINAPVNQRNNLKERFTIYDYLADRVQELGVVN